jgi:NTE family protein
MSKVNPKLALALGAGAARGWAHVGVIRALEEAGIRPGIICGTSIGALVGAAYAAGELTRFEHWITRLKLMDVVGFMDLSLSGGLIKGEKLMGFFKHSFSDRPVQTLELPFGAVATDLHSGAEVWLREGSTADAVRASIALPGLLTPATIGTRTLVDGGLVNPVPVSLARAMGAQIVIAVDLNADILGRHTNETAQTDDAASEGALSQWLTRMQAKLGVQWPRLSEGRSPPVPSLFDVVAASINIMQVRITRSRMAGEPPDAVITPRLSSLGLMDFHEAERAILEGRRATNAALGAIRDALS